MESIGGIRRGLKNELVQKLCIVDARRGASFIVAPCKLELADQTMIIKHEIKTCSSKEIGHSCSLPISVLLVIRTINSHSLTLKLWEHSYS